MTNHSTELLLPARNQAHIGYHPLSVATLVMRDLTVYYFPLYQLNQIEGFNYYALLTFVEGLICQGEEEMEKIAQAKGEDVFAPWRQSKAYILDILTEHKITHPYIKRYLDDVERFFWVIHQLVYQQELTHANIVQAIQLAPADFRLLHTSLCCAAGQAINEQLFDLLEPLEVLRDIHWHLSNFADDNHHNYFNIYQMFLNLYGQSAPVYLKAEQQRWEALLNQRWAKASASHKASLQPIFEAYQQGMETVIFPEADPIIQKML